MERGSDGGGERALRQVGVTNLLLVFVLGLTGCGGGSAGDGAEPGVPGASLAAYAQPGSGEVFGEAEARHLYRRIAFSAPPEEILRAVADGLPATVDRLLDAPPDVTAEEAALAEIEDPLRPSFKELKKSWLSLMRTTQAPARERVALFWHQHLAVSGRMLSKSNLRWMQEYRDILRTHGLGNYREMLYALTRNGAMLVWLSGLPSDKDHPNENYAREFWELFTLGRDVLYREQDVREAARAFTGWDSRWDDVQEIKVLYFDAEAHDEGEKTILGRTGNWGEDDVVDITLETPEAARYLAERLFAGLAYADPESRLVDELATLARDGGWELKPVIRRILLSKAFFSSRARKSQVSDPTPWMVGLARACEIPFEAKDLYYAAEDMGHVPLDPPSVKGWAQGLAWSGEQPLLYRAVVADRLAGKDHVHDADGKDQDHVDVEHLLPMPDDDGQITGAAVVDALARRLDVSLSVAERETLVAYMDTDREEDGTVVPRVFDGTDGDQVDVKVRGLLSILAQHPDALRQ